VSLEVKLKAVFDIEEPGEGMPLAFPSFTMFVTSSEGLGDTWGQRKAIDDMEAIFRDRIVLVKRDELFESIRSKREAILCSKLTTVPHLALDLMDPSDNQLIYLLSPPRRCPISLSQVLGLLYLQTIQWLRRRLVHRLHSLWRHRLRSLWRHRLRSL
jgi:hypothetical protein